MRSESQRLLKKRLFRRSATMAVALFFSLPLAPGSNSTATETPASKVIAEKPLSIREFRSLVNQLAPKVNLFRDVWKLDPKAEFYGGTSRDFVYWLKGEFSQLRTRAEIDAKIKMLRSSSSIDVRDFIVGDSDVDVVTSNGPLPIEARDYSLNKIDFIDPDRLNPGTPEGFDEIRQGFIPVEKIRIGKAGAVKPENFGDGIEEVFSGNLSIHFSKPAEFAETHFAKLNLNHPSLLALRYLRLQAMDYFRNHGKGYPQKQDLMPKSPAIVRKLKSTLKNAENDPEFIKCLQQPKFVEWLNGTIQKTFRSYTNPTAAMVLTQEFGVDKLIKKFSLQPINQYLFSKNWDLNTAAKNFKRYGFSESSILGPASELLPNLELFHGTKTEKDFRAILLQGILPSEVGSADKGLYSVSNRDIPFATTWAGSQNRVVRFEVAPNARIADLSFRDSPGQRLFGLFAKDRPGATYDDFAEAFAIDIIHYPYASSDHAFVVKNSSVLGRPQGAFRQIMTLKKLMDLASSVRTKKDLEQLAVLLSINRVSKAEVRDIASAVGGLAPSEYFHYLAFGVDSQMVNEDFVKVLAAKAAPDLNQLPEAELRAIAKIIDQAVSEDPSAVARLDAWFSSPKSVGYSDDVIGKLARTEVQIFSLGEAFKLLTQYPHWKENAAIQSVLKQETDFREAFDPKNIARTEATLSKITRSAPNDFSIDEIRFISFLIEHAPEKILSKIIGSLDRQKSESPQFERIFGILVDSVGKIKKAKTRYMAQKALMSVLSNESNDKWIDLKTRMLKHLSGDDLFSPHYEDRLDLLRQFEKSFVRRPPLSEKIMTAYLDKVAQIGRWEERLNSFDRLIETFSSSPAKDWTDLRIKLIRGIDRDSSLQYIIYDLKKDPVIPKEVVEALLSKSTTFHIPEIVDSLHYDIITLLDSPSAKGWEDLRLRMIRYSGKTSAWRPLMILNLTDVTMTGPSVSDQVITSMIQRVRELSNYERWQVVDSFKEALSLCRPHHPFLLELTNPPKVQVLIEPAPPPPRSLLSRCQRVFTRLFQNR